MKRLLAFAIAVMMVFAMVPVSVSAEILGSNTYSDQTITYSTSSSAYYYTKNSENVYSNCTVTYNAGMRLVEGVKVTFNNCTVVVNGYFASGSNSTAISLDKNAQLTFNNSTVTVNGGTTGAKNAFSMSQDSKLTLNKSALTINDFDSNGFNQPIKNGYTYVDVLNGSTLTINKCGNKAMLMRVNVKVDNSTLNIADCGAATNGRKYSYGGIGLTLNNAVVNVSGSEEHGLDVRDLTSVASEINVENCGWYALSLVGNNSIDADSTITVTGNGSTAADVDAADEKLPEGFGAIIVNEDATAEILGEIVSSDNDIADVTNNGALTIAVAEGDLEVNGTAADAVEYTVEAPITPNFFLFMFMKRLLTEYAVELVYDDTMGIVEIDDEDGFVRFSTDVEITVAALEGYEVESVLVNGEAVELDEDGAYTIKRIRKDAKVEVTFAEIVEEEIEDAE